MFGLARLPQDAPRVDGSPPGWWSAYEKLASGQSRMTAVVRLPCGHTTNLGDRHTIKADGVVEPSVVCNRKYPHGQLCNWHGFIQLIPAHERNST